MDKALIELICDKERQIEQLEREIEDLKEQSLVFEDKYVVWTHGIVAKEKLARLQELPWHKKQWVAEFGSYRPDEIVFDTEEDAKKYLVGELQRLIDENL